MNSKRYNDAMQYIAEYAANYHSDDVLFEFDYDDPELGATIKAPVSVGEYYINEQNLKNKQGDIVVVKEEYLTVEIAVIECPYCMGDLDCSECEDTGTMPRPPNVLDYMALHIKATRNRWQQGGVDGMLASDVIIDWNLAIKNARELYK